MKSKKEELKYILNICIFSLLIFSLFYGNNSKGGCSKSGDSACGTSCTGTPGCSGKKCGNVDNMCYCDCSGAKHKCKTSVLGDKWNDGIKLADGSYALNGTKGDGKGYNC